jgi:hypothetical protein
VQFHQDFGKPEASQDLQTNLPHHLQTTFK